MEPIHRISATRSGLEAVRGLRPLDRVERDEPRDDEAPRKRRDAPKPPRVDVVDLDDDGIAHVDVQA